MALPSTQVRTWNRDGYLISTDPALVSHEALNKAFDSNQLDWAKKLPTEEIKLMVERSVCFGVYTSPTPDKPTSSRMVGFARIVTDFVTIAYLTDVYILPEHQNQGLGSWLIGCVDEWVGLVTYLRQFLLLAQEGTKEGYYAKKFGTGRMEDSGSGYRFFNRKGSGSAIA